jgi:hypothetical protein
LEKKRMSLIEICIVLALLCATFTASAPSLLRSRDVYLLNAAARDVAGRLYSARAHAVAEGRDCRIRIASMTSYVVECGNAAWEPIERVDLSHNITVTANARPEFHPRGTVAPTATIAVWDAAGRVKRIVVNVNGRVRVQ